MFSHMNECFITWKPGKRGGTYKRLSEWCILDLVGGGAEGLAVQHSGVCKAQEGKDTQ